MVEALTTMTIDMHAHAIVAEVESMVRVEERWRHEVENAARLMGHESIEQNRLLSKSVYTHAMTSLDARIAAMHRMHVDVQVVSAPMHLLLGRSCTR